LSEAAKLKMEIWSDAAFAGMLKDVTVGGVKFPEGGGGGGGGRGGVIAGTLLASPGYVPARISSMLV